MPRKRKINVIIDTNIFISFLIGKRLNGLKINIVNSNVQLIFSEQNIEELKIVTSRDKFATYFNKSDIDELVELIYTIGKVVGISDEPDICRDPKDNFLLALADKSKADFLVTGDSDLLILQKYKQTKIINNNEFEKIMANIR